MSYKWLFEKIGRHDGAILDRDSHLNSTKTAMAFISNLWVKEGLVTQPSVEVSDSVGTAVHLVEKGLSSSLRRKAGAGQDGQEEAQPQG